jgi:hemoglobin
MSSEDTTDSIYERAGGADGLHRVVAEFYASIFEDPILTPVFGHPVETHVEHLCAFLGEVFGGPKRYTQEFGGFPAIVKVHRGRKITEPERARFVELFLKAADAQAMGADSRLREAVRSCIEFGSEIAMVNSNAQSDAELHAQREMPDWHW